MPKYSANMSISSQQPPLSPQAYWQALELDRRAYPPKSRNNSAVNYSLFQCKEQKRCHGTPILRNSPHFWVARPRNTKPAIDAKSFVSPSLSAENRSFSLGLYQLVLGAYLSTYPTIFAFLHYCWCALFKLQASIGTDNNTCTATDAFSSSHNILSLRILQN